MLGECLITQKHDFGSWFLLKENGYMVKGTRYIYNVVGGWIETWLESLGLRYQESNENKQARWDMDCGQGK